MKAKAAPVVDEWSDVEINIAHARCQHLLKQIDAVVIAQPAIKKGPCGDAAPVKLVSIGRSPQVAVSPPAVVNCQMVHALHNWLENDLQPLAKKHLGAKVITIETMSSYSCRNAYGRKTTRLSEHGRANALDIRGFVTATGKRARLLDHWGPTQRAIAHAKNVAKKKALEKVRLLAEKKAAEKARLAARKAAKDSGADRLQTSGADSAAVVAGNGKGGHVPLPVRGTIIEGVGAPLLPNGRAALGIGPSKLGGPKARRRASKKASGSKRGSSATKKSAAVARTGGAALKIPRVSNSRQAQFLRAAFKSGCRRFGTMLGPEANRAHRNHFHVDLAPRKRGNYCE